ncbi:MAG: hypothetical protein V4671_23800, partial [Armatimonadota bacterium]
DTGTPTTPGTGSANGNTGIVPPGTGTSSGTNTGPARPGDGKFYSLDLFDIKVDEVRMGRGSNLEMIVTYKASTDNVGVQPGNFGLTVTDGDGVGVRYNGNLYRASGEDLTLIDGTIWMSRNETTRVRYVFVLPDGVTSLKKLTVQEHGTKPRTFDLSQVQLNTQ